MISHSDKNGRYHLNKIIINNALHFLKGIKNQLSEKIYASYNPLAIM